VPVTASSTISPGAISPMRQSTVPAVVEQAPLAVVATGESSDPGSTSMSRTPRATDGPAFDTVNRYVRDAPAITGSTEGVLLTERSTSSRTSTVDRPELLALLPSAVVEVAVAVFDSGPGGVPEAMTPETVTTTGAPTATSPSVHVTEPLDTEHDPADVDTTAPVNADGSGSPSCTDWATDGPALDTVIVYTRLSPAIAGDGLADFVTCTSARRPTCAVAVAALLPVTESGVVELADAVFAIDGAVYDAATTPVSCTVTLPPLGNVGMVHEAVPMLHVPRSVVIADGANPDGTESAIETDWASEGPAFVTTIVHVADSPAFTDEGVTDFCVCRSARAVTATAAAAELFDVVGSVVAEEPLAVLTMLDPPRTDGATSAVRVTVALAPTASVPTGQVTVPAECEQVMVAGFPTADTNEVPAGRLSLTTVSILVDGPSLRTVTRHTAFSPAFTVGVVAVFETTRSASRTTWVEAVAELFDVVGSDAGPVTDAVFTSDLGVESAGTATTIASGTDDPDARTPPLQVTTCPDRVQMFGSVMMSSPAGIASVTVNDGDEEGPAFVTSSEYVRFSPARTVAGADLVIRRSACGLTLLVAVALLLSGEGSAVDDVTVAGLLRVGLT
jgi:hypothetical protein